MQCSCREWRKDSLKAHIDRGQQFETCRQAHRHARVVEGNGLYEGVVHSNIVQGLEQCKAIVGHKDPGHCIQESQEEHLRHKQCQESETTSEV